MAKEGRKKYNNFVTKESEEVKKPPTRPSSNKSTKSATKEGTFLTDMLFKGKPPAKTKPKPVKQEEEKEDSEEYD